MVSLPPVTVLLRLAQKVNATFRHLLLLARSIDIEQPAEVFHAGGRPHLCRRQGDQTLRCVRLAREARETTQVFLVTGQGSGQGSGQGRRAG